VLGEEDHYNRASTAATKHLRLSIVIMVKGGEVTRKGGGAQTKSSEIQLRSP
jgi:hypothetical protein